MKKITFAIQFKFIKQRINVQRSKNEEWFVKDGLSLLSVMGNELRSIENQ